ncbi:4Fe-4S ferredoxin [Deltaproteobacteria bacterium Smac51]|nr:4Fe-4S ferredoxin [Deltaproteobacteria bacterium Smac51]
MIAPKVYFTDMRCKVGTSLLDKLDKLIMAAGIDQIDFKNKFVAIKMHFGEPGNLAFLRPNFAKAVADRIRLLGGRPFLTDSNTLYVGRRNNALVHLDAAYENGFSPLSTGCQIIIADGLKGGDEVEVPVEGGKVLKSALIGRAIMDADIFISLNHFKGHELTGFGGAIKNIGMGSGSRAGKMVMHCNGKTMVNQEKCVGCRTCAKYCNESAISFNTDKKALIDPDRCVGCGRCIATCNFDALYPPFDGSADDVNLRMVEYSQAVLHGRPHFHVSVVNQVSPNCDCHGESDAAIIADIGIFAGFDPVALDKACIDAVNSAPVLPGTALADSLGHEGGRLGGSQQGHSDDHFHSIHPGTNWRSQISHAEDIGLGTGEYELVTID